MIRRARSAPFLLLLAAASWLAGCGGDGNGSQLQSGTVVTTTGPATEEPATSSTTAATTAQTTTGDPQPGSAEADGFKALTAELPTLGEGVQDYVAASDGARLDELAAGACATVSADMDDEQLGLAGLEAYGQLSDGEQAQVGLSDWVVLFGSLIGYFCPENLPDVDLAGGVPPEGSTVEQFRAVITDIDGVSTEAEDFVAGLGDERLTELHTAACAATSGEMTTDEFGRAIVTSYGNDLSASEQDGIDLGRYSELYGALVGWFCPENLPL